MRFQEDYKTRRTPKFLLIPVIFWILKTEVTTQIQWVCLIPKVRLIQVLAWAVPTVFWICFWRGFAQLKLVKLWTLQLPLLSRSINIWSLGFSDWHGNLLKNTCTVEFLENMGVSSNTWLRATEPLTSTSRGNCCPLAWREVKKNRSLYWVGLRKP